MQYLYLIRCQQYYKIGIANDVQSRLAQLSTGNPFQLSVMAVYGFTNAEPVERAIHQRFAELRARGEWFCLETPDVEDFERICQLLKGTPQDQGAMIDESEIEQAEEAQETQDILLSGIDWRLDRRNGRGYAIFQRGGEKKYLGYVGKHSLKDWEHPTVEEIEAAIEKNRRGQP
jgi:hypothetical protein